jgi:hypothetical protein
MLHEPARGPPPLAPGLLPSLSPPSSPPSSHSPPVSSKSALTSVKQLNLGFSTLIAFLQVNPPASETHFESLEQELALSQQQCEDLRHYRHELYEELDRLQREQKAVLIEKISSYSTQRQQVARQMKDLREGIQKLREELNLGDEGEEGEREFDLLDGRGGTGTGMVPSGGQPRRVSFANETVTGLAATAVSPPRPLPPVSTVAATTTTVTTAGTPKASSMATLMRVAH